MVLSAIPLRPHFLKFYCQFAEGTLVVCSLSACSDQDDCSLAAPTAADLVAAESEAQDPEIAKVEAELAGLMATVSAAAGCVAARLMRALADDTG